LNAPEYINIESSRELHFVTPHLPEVYAMPKQTPVKVLFVCMGKIYKGLCAAWLAEGLGTQMNPPGR